MVLRVLLLVCLSVSSIVADTACCAGCMVGYCLLAYLCFRCQLKRLDHSREVLAFV